MRCDVLVPCLCVLVVRAAWGWAHVEAGVRGVGMLGI